ncbi:MAG: protein SCO1/2 [Flavobacteriales bacterium]|jgi:protein SCO1/2
MSSHQAQVKKNIWRTVTGLLLFILIVLALFINKFLAPRILSNDELHASGVIIFDKPRIIPEFNLIGSADGTANLQDLNGVWTLAFFGFTQCPDICPETLSTLAKAYEGLDDDVKSKVQILFVTLDPARDTPELVQQYINYYLDDGVAFTGSFLEILKFSRNLNIAFSKVAVSDSYTIDHSSQIAIINPHGHYHGFIKAPHNRESLMLTLATLAY